MFLGKRINKYLYYSLKVNRYTCFTIFRFKFIHGKLFFVGNSDFMREKARDNTIFNSFLIQFYMLLKLLKMSLLQSPDEKYEVSDQAIKSVGKNVQPICAVISSTSSKTG